LRKRRTEQLGRAKKRKLNISRLPNSAMNATSQLRERKDDHVA